MISTWNIETSINSIESTVLSAHNIETSTNTVPSPTGIQSSSHFFSPACSVSTHIGSNCNISNLPCDILKPCQNNGICINNNIPPFGYIYSCLSGFSGTQCQFDNRLCQPNTCWNNGICYEISNTTFKCQCASGWQDDHCQTKINYCENIRCLNQGVCQPLLLNYTCLCLDNSYFGRYCENTANKILVFQMMSKSFASIAIIAMISVGIFIVTMDVLKYFFGIDPVGRTLKQLQSVKRRKPKRKKKPVTITRFIYVHAPPQKSSEESISPVEQATV